MDIFLRLRVWWMLRRDCSVSGKIAAIKFVRSKTNWGLAAAKAYIDEIAAK